MRERMTMKERVRQREEEKSIAPDDYFPPEELYDLTRLIMQIMDDILIDFLVMQEEPGEFEIYELEDFHSSSSLLMNELNDIVNSFYKKAIRRCRRRRGNRRYIRKW